jgi:hypothetical protein
MRALGGIAALKFGRPAVNAQPIAPGEIVFRGEDGWTQVAPGVDGQVLTSGGAGSVPTWCDAEHRWSIDGIHCKPGERFVLLTNMENGKDNGIYTVKIGDRV